MNGLILDVIVAVIAVLFIIFGVWRGMYKLIYGLVSSLAAVALAVILASTVTSFVISRTTLDEKLYDVMDERIQSVIPADLDASGVMISYTTDEETGEITVTISHGSSEYDSVADYIKESGKSSVLFNIVNVDDLITSQNTMSVIGATEETTVNTTLAQILSAAGIVYMLLAGVFIVLWIVMYIVIRLIMFVIKKLVTGTYIGHFLDKLLGMAVGAAFALVIIWGALAIIRLLGSYTWILPVNELIGKSTLTKLLYDNNILYNFLVQSANVQKSIAEIFVGLGISGSEPEETVEVAEEAARVIRDIGIRPTI